MKKDYSKALSWFLKATYTNESSDAMLLTQGMAENSKPYLDQMFNVIFSHTNLGDTFVPDQKKEGDQNDSIISNNETVEISLKKKKSPKKFFHVENRLTSSNKVEPEEYCF